MNKARRKVLSTALDHLTAASSILSEVIEGDMDRLNRLNRSMGSFTYPSFSALLTEAKDKLMDAQGSCEAASERFDELIDPNALDDFSLEEFASAYDEAAEFVEDQLQDAQYTIEEVTKQLEDAAHMDAVDMLCSEAGIDAVEEALGSLGAALQSFESAAEQLDDVRQHIEQASEAAEERADQISDLVGDLADQLEDVVDAAHDVQDAFEEAENRFERNLCFLGEYFEQLQSVHSAFELARQLLDDAIDKAQDVRDFCLSALPDSSECEETFSWTQACLSVAGSAFDDAFDALHKLEDLDQQMGFFPFLLEKTWGRKLFMMFIWKLLGEREHNQAASDASMELEDAVTEINDAIDSLHNLDTLQADKVPVEDEHIEAAWKVKSTLDDAAQHIQEAMDSLQEAADLQKGYSRSSRTFKRISRAEAFAVRRAQRGDSVHDTFSSAFTDALEHVKDAYGVVKDVLAEEQKSFENQPRSIRYSTWGWITQMENGDRLLLVTSSIEKALDGLDELRDLDLPTDCSLDELYNAIRARSDALDEIVQQIQEAVDQISGIVIG